MTDGTEGRLIDRRKARNEDAFRTANEQVERAAALANTTAGERIPFLCECADIDCDEIVELTVPEYEMVREKPHRFVVADGHEDGNDQIVDHPRGFVVIEKSGIEAKLTSLLDERSIDVDTGDGVARIARNEEVFRHVNERIAGSASRLAKGSDHIDIACECGDLRCANLLRVRLSDYRDVRAHPTRFVITRGHRARDTEVVVYRRGDVEVVQKIGLGAAVSKKARQ